MLILFGVAKPEMYTVHSATLLGVGEARQD